MKLSQFKFKLPEELIAQYPSGYYKDAKGREKKRAKFDAERGEGIDIARKYRVEGYPTFLILNAEGKEVGRIVGGDDAAAFIKKVDGVLANIQ